MNKLWITTFAIIVSCAGAAHADNDGASMIVKTVDGDNDDSKTGRGSIPSGILDAQNR